ncbi:MAG: alkylation response protein AidB-like acyl-CoA dehydrogenase [Candidatus Azotimanducaceae bacterium]|jgi:alkylation response protein AidB-like acyl-CoA dehydrogenase
MAALNEEQTMIREQAKSWVSEQAPVRKFREVRDSGNELAFAAPTWQSMVEMGWTGIIIPEEYGGSDLGFLTFGLILEETGKHLTASPLFASALVGATSVMLGGSEAIKQAVLPGIVAGDQIVTLALEEGPRHKPEATALSAEKSGNGFKLTGDKTFVAEGMSATSYIVPARTSGVAGDTHGISLFLVPADAQGVSRNAMHMMDSRGYANVQFDGVMVESGNLLGELDNGFGLLEQILDRARAGLCAEMHGTASQAFDMTLDYLKTRVQFGQVIGAFQALGHRAADLYTAKEMTRSCFEAALKTIDDDADNIPEMVALAKARVGEYLHEMSCQLIQIHGGIGMTDEFDAGFYLKRARILETSFGNQGFHRERYARILGF